MKKILIADHVEHYRNILKRSLEAHGFSVIEAGSVDELFSSRPDDVMLVLLADTLGDASAFDVLEKVAGNTKFSALPFIICTAREDPLYIAECVKRGFKDVVLRPYNRKAVFRVIKKYLVESGILDKSLFFGDEQAERVSEKDKIEFLREVIEMAPKPIEPASNLEVNTGYAYPFVNEFFGLTPGEEYQILREFYDDGILSRTLVDKVGMCPKCNFHTVNFREICPKCGSLDINIEAVYHHFECGYIGLAEDFKSPGDDGMTCPKCDKKLRHIGLDYEKPSDTFVCADCSYIFTEPDVDFNCAYCDLVAPADKIIVARIYSYHPTVKAEKIVEYGSFSAFNIKEMFGSDDLGRYSRDFFDYMLKMRYQEHLEFGDSLVIQVTSFEDFPDRSDEFSDRVMRCAGRTDILFKADKFVVVQAVSRKPVSMVAAAAGELISFAKELASPGKHCRVMLREFNDELHNIADFVDSTYEIFLANKNEITDEVVVYDE